MSRWNFFPLDHYWVKNVTPKIHRSYPIEGNRNTKECEKQKHYCLPKMQPEQEAKFDTVTCFFSFTSAIFSCGMPLITNVYEYLMAVFRLFQIAFAPTRKQIRIGLLFTDKKRWFRPDFCDGSSEAAPLRSRKWKVTYRMGSVPHFRAVWSGIRSVAEVNK